MSPFLTDKEVKGFRIKETPDVRCCGECWRVLAASLMVSFLICPCNLLIRYMSDFLGT